MSLSKELVAKFVKITNDRTKPQTETTLYGEITEYAGEKYVKLDGSDQLTPISSMSSTVGLTGVKVGDRVMVMIKNHTAVLIGNTSQPSINKNDLNNVTNGAGDAITELYALVADKVSASELNAVAGRIETLETDYLTVNGTLNAQSATVNEIKSAHVTITSTLTAQDADIKKLSTDKLDASVAAIKYATIEKLESIEGDFHTLESTYAKFEKTTTSTLTAIDGTIKSLDTKYANIDFSNIGEAAIKKFYSTSGIIKNLTVSNGVYTGELAGVKISGDLITANTLVADKLVIKGTNGLYYKLNTDGVKTEAEQTEYNSLNGKVILAKSIAATKISVTDLVAFGATIGGFHITNTSLYSGVKSSIDNTTRGSYLDTDGQVVFGDKNYYIKYFKDTDSVYKLAISARDIILNGGSLSSKFDDLTVKINDIEIGGRNLLRNSKLVQMYSNNPNVYPVECSKVTENGVSFYRVRRTNIDTYPNTTMSVYSILNKDMFAYGAMAGKQVTLSFKARVSHPITGSFMDFTFGGDSVVDFGKAAEQFTTEWKTYYVTIDSFPDLTNRTGVRWNPYNFLLPADILGDFYLDIREYKFEFGNKPTDWTPAPEDVDDSIANASKTATNYLNFSSSGLVVGDHTAGALNKNVLIDSEAVKVRTGSTVNAVFGADIIELAKSNESATISMLNGAFKIYYDNTIEDGGFGIYGRTTSGQMRLAFQPVNENNNLTLGWGGYADKSNSTNLYGNKMYLTTNEDIIINPGSGNVQMDGNVLLTNGKNIFGVSTSGAPRSMAIWNASNQLLFGYGSYVNNEGSVYYDGNDINIRSKNDIRLTTMNETVMLQDGDGNATYSAFFKPNSDAKCTLGTNANRWYAVYASNATVQTSDAREKENLVSLDSRHSKLFDKLRPVQFNFINGNGRLCYGLVAQEVLAAMDELGIGEHDLDLVHHDTWFDEKIQATKDSFGLAYANLIAMLIYEVQQLKRERGHNYA